MTDADLIKQGQAQAVVVAQWNQAVARGIKSAVEKAQQHAFMALTDVLAKTPPGRPSLRRIDQNPSYQAASASLDHLWEWLAGGSVVAVKGKLRDAREALYVRSFEWWIKTLPLSHSVGPDAEPPAARLNEVRGLTLHGMELRREVGAKIETARRNLLATLEKSTRPGVISKDAIDLVRGWAEKTRQSLLLVCDTAIGDAAVAVEGIAAVDAIRPEFRPRDGIAPE